MRPFFLTLPLTLLLAGGTAIQAEETVFGNPVSITNSSKYPWRLVSRSLWYDLHVTLTEPGGKTRIWVCTAGDLKISHELMSGKGNSDRYDRFFRADIILMPGAAARLEFPKQLDTMGSVEFNVVDVHNRTLDRLVSQGGCLSYQLVEKGASHRGRWQVVIGPAVDHEYLRLPFSEGHGTDKLELKENSWDRWGRVVVRPYQEETIEAPNGKAEAWEEQARARGGGQGRNDKAWQDLRIVTLGRQRVEVEDQEAMEKLAQDRKDRDAAAAAKKKGRHP